MDDASWMAKLREIFVCIFLAFFWMNIPAYAAELQRFENVSLIPNPANDGDSFYVKAGNKTLHFVSVKAINAAMMTPYTPTRMALAGAPSLPMIFRGRQ